MNSNLRKYKVISRIFDPIILAPVAFIIVINLYAVSRLHSIFIFIILFLIPFGFFFYSLLKKKIDYDLTDRRTRIPLFLTLLASSISSDILLYAWGHKELAQLLLVLALIIFTVLCITFFWKISLHALVNTIFFGFIGLLYSHTILFLVIPIVTMVGYSRIKLEKHSISQIIAGFFLGIASLVILYFVYD